MPFAGSPRRDRRPLHLAVEPYVRCPRGGLAPLARCEACDLMQGTVSGGRLEVLCAYPEAVPALRFARSSSEAGRVALPVNEGADDAASPPEALVFDADWPED